jgi:hypothetical protein
MRCGAGLNNKTIRVVSVELSHPYAADEKSYGRCRWMKVNATTDDGIRFLLYDDTKGVSNLRQYMYGSGDDPVSWGSNLPDYSKSPSVHSADRSMMCT